MVRPALVLGAWFLTALAFGALGGLRMAPPPFPQLMLFGLLGALVIAYASISPFRVWLDGLPLDALVAVHLSRFVGFYFLHLHARNELPYAFAVPGGWGDIGVALLASLLLVLGRLGRPAPPWAYAAWNLIGLADILFVVATARRLALVDPASMEALLRPPLSLLPTFLVPILIFSHVVLLRRLPPGSRKRGR